MEKMGRSFSSIAAQKALSCVRQAATSLAHSLKLCWSRMTCNWAAALSRTSRVNALVSSASSFMERTTPRRSSSHSV